MVRWGATIHSGANIICAIMDLCRPTKRERRMKNTVFALAAILCGCAKQATQEPAASAGAQADARTAQAAPAKPAQSSISVASGASDAKAVPAKRSIYYAYDQAEITGESRKLIEAHADYPRTHPALKVAIERN